MYVDAARSPVGRGNFADRGAPIGTSVMSFAKTAEPIDLSFGLWTPVRRMKHNFNRIHQLAPMWTHGRTYCRHLVNTIEPSVCGGDVPSILSNYFEHLLSLAMPT